MSQMHHIDRDLAKVLFTKMPPILDEGVTYTWRMNIQRAHESQFTSAFSVSADSVRIGDPSPPVGVPREAVDPVLKNMVGVYVKEDLPKEVVRTAIHYAMLRATQTDKDMG